MIKKKDSEKSLPPTSAFIEELHTSMSSLLQDLFESEQEILTLAENSFLPTLPNKSPCKIQEQHTLMQKDLVALKALCHNLLQE